MSVLRRAALFAAAAAGLSVAQADSLEAPRARTAQAASYEDGPRPFDEARDATADVDAALAAAGRSGKRVLLVLGANWCHDSRGLAKKFEDPTLAALIAAAYELVWVDVGQRDRNLHVARRFGVFELLGTPTVLIASAGGELLNGASAHDWRNADSRSLQETIDYFRRWRPAA